MRDHGLMALLQCERSLPNGASLGPVFAAANDGESSARVFSADSVCRHAFGRWEEASTRANDPDAIPPHPDMADAGIAVDAIIGAGSFSGRRRPCPSG